MGIRLVKFKNVDTYNLVVTKRELEEVRDTVSRWWYPYFGIDRKVGICGRLSDASHISQFFKYWDRYSGDPNFPVPYTDNKVSPIRAYTEKPLWRGQYGKLRKELLDFCIQKVTEELSFREELQKSD